MDCDVVNYGASATAPCLSYAMCGQGRPRRSSIVLPRPDHNAGLAQLWQTALPQQRQTGEMRKLWQNKPPFSVCSTVSSCHNLAKSPDWSSCGNSKGSVVPKLLSVSQAMGLSKTGVVVPVWSTLWPGRLDEVSQSLENRRASALMLSDVVQQEDEK